MPDPRDRLALIEIGESAALIRAFLAGFDENAFLADRRTCDAVVMHVFVISEAASRLSEDARDALGPLPWDQMRGVRNRIAYGYAGVDFTRVWRIATADVPELDAAARRALGDDPDLLGPA
ncbi:MAG: DUF86 domain-containing protein [Hyphomonadaceae bacterium]